MKIYINDVNEDWIVDRFRKEFYQYNQNIVTTDISKADIIWVISPWAWRKVPKRFLSKKKVICTIHHIDEEKFKGKEGKEFYKLDKYVDFYHTISEKSLNQLNKLTRKKIYNIPFWVNNKIWFDIPDKEGLKKKYSLPQDNFIIGSFQRDTEGKDGVSPKLSKGPDHLIKILKEFKFNQPTFVVLAGRRRQYVIKNLIENEIPFKYFENVDLKTLNELYNSLDLYIVSSRIEGGPQAIFEAGLSKTPIISTNVGAAGEFLASCSIYKIENFKQAKTDIDTAYNNIIKIKIPQGFARFIEMFNTLI